MASTTARLQRLGNMLLIRRFEERLVRLHEDRAFRGHFHVSIGQESAAVAFCGPLAADDYLFTTHRNHAHLLARGADPSRLFAEILGRADGYNGGRGGTLHAAAPDLHVPVTSALVGGNLPIATGVGLALKRRGTSAVVVAFFGDAVLEEGAFYEAMNLAVLWQLPVLYVCENNSLAHEKRKPGQYPSSRLSNDDLTALPADFGIPSESIGGADTGALVKLADRLTAEVRAGGGPRFVEVQFERWPGNYDLWPAMVGSETDVAWAWGAEPPAEVADWVRHADPLLLEAAAVVDEGLAARDDVVAMDQSARGRIEAAAQDAVASPMPVPEHAHLHVHGNQ